MWLNQSIGFSYKIDTEDLWEKTKSDNIYWQYPFLQNHRQFLWELNNHHLVWDWETGIRVEPNNKSIYDQMWLSQEKLIIKIWVDEQWEKSIKLEISNHSKFFEKFNKIKQKLLVNSWILPSRVDKFRVLPIYEISYSNTEYYIVKKIEWQSLFTKVLRKWFKKLLINESDEDLDKMTDLQFKNLLIDKYSIDDFYFDNNKSTALEALKNLYWEENPEIVDLYKIMLRDLRENSLIHDDMHSWNVVVDKNWFFYIIDFESITIDWKDLHIYSSDID